jgi:hypothetical protein
MSIFVGLSLDISIFATIKNNLSSYNPDGAPIGIFLQKGLTHQPNLFYIITKRKFPQLRLKER